LPAENIHNGFWIGRCYPGTAFVGIQKVLKSNSIRNFIIIFDAFTPLLLSLDSLLSKIVKSASINGKILQRKL
jgi:hypothetical protein